MDRAGRVGRACAGNIRPLRAGQRVLKGIGKLAGRVLRALSSLSPSAQINLQPSTDGAARLFSSMLASVPVAAVLCTSTGDPLATQPRNEAMPALKPCVPVPPRLTVSVGVLPA